MMGQKKAGTTAGGIIFTLKIKEGSFKKQNIFLPASCDFYQVEQG